MNWRKKVMWLAGVVVLVELVALGCHWWWQPAPLPQAGMLGKEPVRYRKVDDKIDYAKVKESKYRSPRTPEQAVYEFFVAMNCDDWERFKQLTVGREELARNMKLTEAEQHKFMTDIGKMGPRGSRIVATHFIEHQGDRYVVMVFNPDGWKMIILFPLVNRFGSWRVDVLGLDSKQNPISRAVTDNALLEKLN
jgi:hypothetical protein